ncbi:flagellar biosynthesis protein FlhF [Lysobacter sp. FW306-1B-D06B]|uniref:flagellar biosynthesis protein FlhF n=1 Tax=Lysobacter sp. FW306-1B-D06B TaxID=3140250 RepID=UPI003140A1D4
MRIKRFIAPDMRTALRMVRDEQGPDAVILSNRPVEDGIEIVSATDYDESLAQQALRAALPSLPAAPAPVASPSTPATVAAVVPMTKSMSNASNEAPPPLRAGGEEGRLRATGARPDERLRAMPEGRDSWGGVAKPRSGELGADAPHYSLPTSPAKEGEEQKSSRMSSLAALLTKPVKGKPAWTAPSAESTVEMERVEMQRIEIEDEEPAVVALSDKARAKIAESPIRGRAVFAIGDGTRVETAPRAPKVETQVADARPKPDTSRFDAMMAALIPQGEKFEAAAAAFAQTAPAGTSASHDAPVQEATRDSVTDPTHVAPTAAVGIGDAAPSLSADVAALEGARTTQPSEPISHEYRSLADLWSDDALLPSPDGRGIEGEGRNQDHLADGTAFKGSASYVDLLTNHSVAPHPDPQAQTHSVWAFDGARTSGSQAAPSHSERRGAQALAPQTPAAAPHLHAVADARDPSMLAMRDELATMRAMIEREFGQLTVERLRGSPARAAAFDLLMSYGCDENLAQTIAGRIDARLDPAQVREPMLEELARAISVARHEPIDDGGVIALVGPTGAGKTTTAAKLAARFAQRHRARDVALVTTDTERPGATEQLHILGRRLGVTVCEANGPEALNDALDQLADYPLVLVDTAGHGLRDRALLGQILWLRAAKRVRSLLVLPANTNAHDLGEVVRRYRPASPEGVVLTKLDETGRLGSPLSVLVQHGLSLAYTTDGQQVPTDIAAADARRLVLTLEKVRRAADNPLGSLDARPVTLPTEDRHAIAS